MSILSIALALLGLGFLIFIHELGHYVCAKRAGMRVDVFSIGLGKPVWSWVRAGVKWQICWIPFGGYVKIGGMEKEDHREPHEIPDGFFGKSPLARIKVLFMGPFVNIVFAFILFGVLWLVGGREKPFSDYTHYIGWVDPQSELFAQGVRPGDRIVAYNDHPMKSSHDHLYAAMLSDETVKVEGIKVDYSTREEEPFEYDVHSYAHPRVLTSGILTTGILDSAGYLIYDRLPGGKENPLPEGSPMEGSGLSYGDRLVWVDGHLLFSLAQLRHLLNDGRALVTIQRGEETLLRRVPRFPIAEYLLSPDQKEELNDWHFEVGLEAPVQDLLYLPYDVTIQGVIEKPFSFIDEDVQEEAFPSFLLSDVDEALLPGDRILAVDGVPVKQAYEVLRQLQQRRIHLIVERGTDYRTPILWDRADERWNETLQWTDVEALAKGIGFSGQPQKAGSLQLLHPVEPKLRSAFPISEEQKAWVTAELMEERKKIEEISDAALRERALEVFEKTQNSLLIGIPLQGRPVIYNPLPFTAFSNALSNMGRTLSSLLAGDLNPKWLSGPVGIIQVIHHGWMTGAKEALFWMAFISLGVGTLNLIPIPPFDGGYIFLSLIEMVTRKPIQAKTMERLVIPFVVLIIGFFLFITYHDLSRLFTYIFQ